MRDILIIINDAPYGTEKAYNVLRLANQLLKDHSDLKVNIFLLADAVSCGTSAQKTPDGYYNIGRMLKVFIRKGGHVKSCGTCMDARGMTQLPLEEGVERSNMTEFAQWTIDADKVITF
ncbi:MAG: DsrE/DsrF/TusD sulfur relay family protein [Bacteroidota bacterium]